MHFDNNRSFVIIDIIPLQKNVQENPFVIEEGTLLMLAAHRGGGANKPKRMILAFREAAENMIVDAIMTDDPRLLRDVLEEYK